MQTQLLIYTHKITPRNKFILNFIFTDVLGVAIEITANAELFLNDSRKKISYTNAPFGDELFFASKLFLFETGIVDQQLAISKYKDLPCFYTVGKKSALPFDPFAASFYLVSRYEEYLPQMKDRYMRYVPEQSLAYENGFLDIPIVDKWAYFVKDAVIAHYPDFSFPEKKFTFMPTIDIDNAYAYAHKGFMRTVGGISRSLMRLDFPMLVERLKVVSKMKQDPYDRFEMMENLHKQYDLQAKYFFLFAQYGINDKNINTENKTFQSLIKSTSDYFDVGIHPSFASNDDMSLLKNEINELSAVLNSEVTMSRQHFLMLNLPDTYHRLLDLGIREDYTMGYASHIGFRAGTCTPFYFYDIEMEVQTNLKVIPFQIMDASLKYYYNLDVEDVMSKISPVIDAVKEVNGTLVTLWHNESLSGMPPWTGWEPVYEEMIKYVVAR